LPSPQGATTPRPAYDQVVRLENCLDALEFVLGHLDVEFLLERHHEFDEVEAVCVEIVAELGVWRHLISGNREHLDGTLAETREQLFVDCLVDVFFLDHVILFDVFLRHVFCHDERLLVGVGTGHSVGSWLRPATQLGVWTSKECLEFSAHVAQLLFVPPSFQPRPRWSSSQARARVNGPSRGRRRRGSPRR
jgi:hypothetical protein